MWVSVSSLCDVAKWGPLNMLTSKKVILLVLISDVNLMVGWNSFMDQVVQT